MEISAELRRLAGGAVRRIRAAGWKRQCPCCGRRVGQFLSYHSRPNVLCPRCGAKVRHRSIWVYLRDRTDLFDAPHRILQVAPEPHLRRVLEDQPGNRVVSFDMAMPGVSCRGDLTRLPFRDAAFDVLIAIHVLEHIPDDGAAMSELRRVLSPGGWGVLQVPLDHDRAETFEPPVETDDERLHLFGKIDHVRIYGRDYADRLRSAGFEVDIDDHLPRLPAEVKERNGLRDERIYRVSA